MHPPPMALQDDLKPLEAFERERHFYRMMAELAAQNCEEQTVMIDATYLNAHRTACSLRANTYGPPRLQAAIFDDMISLHKRIRHVGTVSAVKMEIRASRSS